MALSKRPVPDGFEALTETISIYRPDVPDDGTSPSLIVICSWMAALPKHITKYTDQYKKLFPSSTIFVIQSYWQDVAASDEKMVTRLALATEIIKTHTPIQQENSQQGNNKVLLHIFSNGGATTANHLSLHLRPHRLALQNQTLPNNNNQQARKLFHRVILECTPSRPDVTLAVRAVAYTLPHSPSILRFIGLILLRCYIAFGLWQCRLRGVENMVDRIRRRLNETDNKPTSSSPSSSSSDTLEVKRDDDTQLWDPTVPRLYLYSKADEVVQWEAVRDHANDARTVAKFEVVREEVFETAKHVSLPRENFGRYWGVVEGWMRGTAGAT